MAHKTSDELDKVSTFCLDVHHRKTRRSGNCGTVVRDLLPNCIEMLVLGKIWKTGCTSDSQLSWPDRSHSVTERATFDWHVSPATFITQRTTNRPVTWDIKQQTASWGYSKDADVARNRTDSKSTSDGVLCVFRSHTFVPISRACEKQTAVSHSSTVMQDYGWKAFQQ